MIDDVTSRPGTDWAPYLVLPLVALLALPGMSLPAWLTLTIGPFS